MIVLLPNYVNQNTTQGSTYVKENVINKCH